jgi:hypothetical protein
MKTFLSILLIAGVALGYSTSYYGWVPSKEYTYHFESQVLTGIPELRSQYSGLKISSRVQIQSFPDYSLRIKFVEPKFWTVNEELPTIDGRIEVPSVSHEEVPEAIRAPLIVPFEAHIKRGVIESVFVQKSEPVIVTNLKKALLAQLQMDLSGSREGSVQKLNHVVLPQTAQEEMRNVSFFSTMETSLHGDCETSYTLHPLPLYQARELEEEWRVHKIKVIKTLPMYTSKVTTEQVMRESQQAEAICNGQQYYQVTKTKNFENCRERPVFSAWSAIKPRCDPAQGMCEDLMTAVSTTKYVVCGSPEQFVIRKVTGENIISANTMGWNTEEKLQTTSHISLELLNVQTSGFQPLPKPTEPKQLNSLLMEFPETKTLNSKAISDNLVRNGPKSIVSGLSKSLSQEEQLKSLTGFYPIHPMPELNSAPQLLFPTSIPKPELYHQVKELMLKICKESFESPESCSSSSDVAGYLYAVAKALRPLSLEELKQAREEVIRSMETQTPEIKKTAKYLLTDVLSMVATNPSVVLIKELIESQEIPIEHAPQIMQSTLKYVKTPTPELMNMIFSLAKVSKTKSQQLYSVTCVGFSDLLYRACVNPSSMSVEFPTRIYGNFCNPESPIIKEQWIPYLTTQLEQSQQKSSEEQVILVQSLGKLGHYSVVAPLLKVIEGEVTKKPIVRSMGVYALKRTGFLYPTIVRPVVLSLIDNPAENPEVRIAAVSILPYTDPTIAELQKMAIRTWYEPSKQVTAFIYSTLKSLKHTEVPELLPLRSKVQSILGMVKPVESGIQFSHNMHTSKFVEYLKVVAANGIQLVNSEESLVPKKISYVSSLINRSWKIEGLTFDLYTQGMDYVLEKFLTLTSLRPETTESVRSELQKIQESLQITKRGILEPEAHLNVKFMGIERLFTFNTEFYMQTVQKISEQLRTNPTVFTTGLPYQYTKAQKMSEIQIIGPTDSGFPIKYESSTPLVYSVRGVVKASTNGGETIPTSVRATLIPVFNIKVQNVLGVISPFTKQFIGSGIELAAHTSLPLETIVSMNREGQVSLALKTPEIIQKEIELLHLNVKPFTFKKSMQTIAPASQSAGNKMILSGNPVKHYQVNPVKQSLGLDLPVHVSTDYPTFDLATFVRKVTSAPSVMSAIDTIMMPGTVRYMSLQVRYNPTSSQTKEVQTRFTLAHAIKNAPSDIVQVKFPKTLSMNHDEEIKKMCVENNPSGPAVEQCIEHQKRQVRTVSDVSEQDKRLCKKSLLLEEVNPTSAELEHCLKSAKLCEQSKIVCMNKVQQGPTTRPVHPGSVGTAELLKQCTIKKASCQMRQMNLQKMQTILRKLGMGSAISVGVEASLNTHYEKTAVSTIVSLGLKRTGQQIKSFVEVDAKIPTIDSPLFVEAEIDAKLPELKSKWSKEQILSDDLSLKTLVTVHFGLKSQPKNTMKKVEIELIGSKTESQNQAVRNSPEYSQCVQQEGEGRPLSPVCEYVRHQAASLDKFVMKVTAGWELKTSPSVLYIRNAIESVLYPYISERTYESNTVSSLSRNQFVVQAMFSRQGEEAHFKYQQPGFEWDIEDVRMPHVLKNVLPLSLRNGLGIRLLQKVSSQQTPASCRIESQYVNTFDNKTYSYSLNDCEHLLVKDCSGTFPIAVTARGASGQKLLKIVAGQSIVELKPVQGSVINGVYVNGQHKTLSQGETLKIKNPTTKRVTLEIKSYLDGVLVVREFESSLEVSFDGQHIEVVAPQLIRSRACGLCGDMNGESTADLRTPKMCVFQKARIAAYSYMLPEPSCQGVPQQDKPEYEKEVRECIKKVIVPTPLEDLTKRQVMVKSGPKGVITKHLVEYRANGNEMCFSKVVIPVCKQGSVPVIGHMSSTPFTCFVTHTELAQRIKSKIQFNEEISELKFYPTTYNRMIEEASGCRTPTQGGLHASEDSTPTSSKYQPGAGRFHPQLYDY